jgi:hypothetical protein
MEDEEEVPSPGMLPPVAASLESRSKRKMVTGNRGGCGRGRGSVAAKSTTPSASVSVDTDTVYIFLDDLIGRRCSLGWMCHVCDSCEQEPCRMPPCQFIYVCSCEHM